MYVSFILYSDEHFKFKKKVVKKNFCEYLEEKSEIFTQEENSEKLFVDIQLFFGLNI